MWLTESIIGSVREMMSNNVPARAVGFCSERTLSGTVRVCSGILRLASAKK